MKTNRRRAAPDGMLWGGILLITAWGAVMLIIVWAIVEGMRT
ncbi:MULTISPECIES: hypothetical protein [unclassified Streptomyces]|nr:MULTISPECIES: hypothetical protein [unclassified Streptomyces]SCK25729.1 hypothetical protein YW7DRAFT_01977 [Streptomyces sp. AmelKG-E11A]